MDMTMCVNDLCKSKQQCFRYIAEPNSSYQSYSIFVDSVRAKVVDRCDWFIKASLELQINSIITTTSKRRIKIRR